MTEAEHLGKCHPILQERLADVLPAWRAQAAPERALHARAVPGEAGIVARIA